MCLAVGSMGWQSQNGFNKLPTNNTKANNEWQSAPTLPFVTFGYKFGKLKSTLYNKLEEFKLTFFTKENFGMN